MCHVAKSGPAIFDRFFGKPVDIVTLLAAIAALMTAPPNPRTAIKRLNSFPDQLRAHLRIFTIGPDLASIIVHAPNVSITTAASSRGQPVQYDACRLRMSALTECHVMRGR